MTTSPTSDRRPGSETDSPSFVARDLGGLAALVVVAGTVLATGSPRESIVAVPFLLAAVFTPSTVAFAAGQLAVLPVLSVEEAVPLAVAQLALVVMFVEPTRTRGVPYAAGATLVAYAGLVALLAVGFRDGLLVAGGLLCLAVAFGTYLARRVTLVRLGLVGDDEAADTPERPDEAADTPTPSDADRPADRSLTEAKE